MTPVAEASSQPPQLASNIEGFDNSLKLLIAVAARAAANLQLPQDASLPSTDITTITQNLAAFKLNAEQPVESAVPAATAPALNAPDTDKGDPVDEVDAVEVQEAAKAIAAAAKEVPQLSQEELHREREKLRASINKVEAANADAARLRKKQALDWADEVAKHCNFGRQQDEDEHLSRSVLLMLRWLPQIPKPCRRVHGQQTSNPL